MFFEVHNIILYWSGLRKKYDYFCLMALLTVFQLFMEESSVHNETTSTFLFIHYLYW
jgi:hypothetical protein